MDATLAAFDARLRLPWLADPGDAERFARAYADTGARLDERPGALVVAEPERADYLGAVFAALARQRTVFLANAAWRETEWREAAAILPADALRGDSVPEIVFSGPDDGPGRDAYAGCLLVATGGTGGRVKFAAHNWDTLHAAVTGYAAYWDRKRLHAVCPLPVCHVGGLMLAVRTWMTGGRLWLPDARLEVRPPMGFPLAEAHVSLVGAQLNHALAEPGHWLASTGVVLVGGGPPRLEWLHDARRAGVPLFAAYGLTEAAATVALAQADAPTAATVLPGWAVSVTDGRIHLNGPALFRGYWGSPIRMAGPWCTGDCGELDADGRLHVLGRTGRFIVTGGRKVDADWLERELAAWPEIRAVAVDARPDARWGQVVCAAVASDADAAGLRERARARLAPEARPKVWQVMPVLPCTAMGKPDRRALFGDEQQVNDAERSQD